MDRLILPDQLFILLHTFQDLKSIPLFILHYVDLFLQLQIPWIALPVKQGFFYPEKLGPSAYGRTLQKKGGTEKKSSLSIQSAFPVKSHDRQNPAG